MNSSLKGKIVHFYDDYLHVTLTDDRIISTPLHWYKPLQQASHNTLKNYRFVCMGAGIKWEELDYHLSIKRMFSAANEIDKIHLIDYNRLWFLHKNIFYTIKGENSIKNFLEDITRQDFTIVDDYGAPLTRRISNFLDELQKDGTHTAIKECIDLNWPEFLI